jgi:quercetin dioxygenase-like cupin family protein
MSISDYFIKQLTQELTTPDTGKQSVVLLDNSKIKAILFSFAAGSGLTEHVAPLDATIQIISGEAAITVGLESVDGIPGTWIHMTAKTPHSIAASTPVVMLLTLLR